MEKIELKEGRSYLARETGSSAGEIKFIHIYRITETCYQYTINKGVSKGWGETFNPFIEKENFHSKYTVIEELNNI